MQESSRKLKNQLDSNFKFFEKQLQSQQDQINRIGEEIAFDVVKIERSAKRANKLVFELQKEQYASRNSDAVVEPSPSEKTTKDLEARIKWLEKHKLNKCDFEAIGSRLLKMKSSVETVKQVQKWTTQAVETILAQIYKRNNLHQEAERETV